MFINRQSSSKSDTISQCLYKYKCRYVLRIPEFPTKGIENLNFGSFIHKVFEEGYSLNHIKDLEKLAENYKENYKIGYKYKDETVRCLENFLKLNSKLSHPIATELDFEVDLDKDADIKYTGIIDRVNKGVKGGYLILDYKTSKREKTRADLMKDNQLMGYVFAIHKLYGVPYEQIYAGHYYPRSGNLVDVKFSRNAIDRWQRREINKVWKIRKKKKDEFPPMANQFCDWCGYKPVCPLYNSQKEVECKLNEAIQKKAKKE